MKYTFAQTSSAVSHFYLNPVTLSFGGTGFFYAKREWDDPDVKSFNELKSYFCISDQTSWL